MDSLAFLQNLGAPELMIILLIVLLLFGANKVPQMMKGFGQGIREFKKGMNEDEKGKGETQASTDESKNKPTDPAKPADH
jgi:sec-independent protein translocase protein TatA